MLVDIYIITKSVYQMSINKERTTTAQGAHANLIRIISFLLFSLLVKNFEEEIQSSEDRVDTSRG